MALIIDLIHDDVPHATEGLGDPAPAGDGSRHGVLRVEAEGLAELENATMEPDVAVIGIGAEEADRGVLDDLAEQVRHRRGHDTSLSFQPRVVHRVRGVQVGVHSGPDVTRRSERGACIAGQGSRLGLQAGPARQVGRP